MKTEIETLKENLTLDPKTGELKWRTGKSGPIKHNGVVGTLGTKGYWQVMINYKLYLSHRVVFALHYGRFPHNKLDHINGDKADNRIINLREVTSQQNNLNQKVGSKNTSGCIGVYFNINRMRWAAQIKFGGKNMPLGTFDEYQDAVNARKDAEEILGFHPNHGTR